MTRGEGRADALVRTCGASAKKYDWTCPSTLQRGTSPAPRLPMIAFVHQMWFSSWKMSLVFRHHLSSSHAHILAGVLATHGIPAAVVGDLAAPLYGGTPLLDCSLAVPQDFVEEAEHVLRSAITEEPPDDSLPPEQGPSDGDPPGVGAVLCASLLLAAAGFAVHVFVELLFIFATYASPEGYLSGALQPLFFRELPGLMIAALLHAVGAGLLLRIIRGYRRGSLFYRVIVKTLLLVLIL